MPTVLKVQGYRFFFFSDESNEPPHVHVEKGEGYAKFWLEPLCLAYSERLKRPQIKRIRELTAEYKKFFVEKWNEYFNR